MGISYLICSVTNLTSSLGEKTSLLMPVVIKAGLVLARVYTFPSPDIVRSCPTQPYRSRDQGGLPQHCCALPQKTLDMKWIFWARKLWPVLGSAVTAVLSRAAWRRWVTERYGTVTTNICLTTKDHSFGSLLGSFPRCSLTGNRTLLPWC